MDIDGGDSLLGVAQRLTIHRERSLISFHAADSVLREYGPAIINLACVQIDTTEVRHQVIPASVGTKGNPAALAVEHLRQQQLRSASGRRIRGGGWLNYEAKVD